MHAVVLERFGGPELFRWSEWPTPVPGPGEVRIRVRAVSVNPVDYKMRRGLIPVQLPAVLGRDAAGVVDAVGPGVDALRPGDEVFAVLLGPRSNGAYAEYAAVPAPFVSRRPRGLSDAEGAALGVAGLTAYEAVVRRARVRSGEAVLVAGGAGGVGSLAIPILRHLGASPILATAGGEASAEHLVDTLGVRAEDLVPYRGRSLDDLEALVRERTGGRGVAAAFDFVGGEMKALCVRCLGLGGRAVSIVEEPSGFALDVWGAASPLFTRSGTLHIVSLSAHARSADPRDWSVYPELLAGLAGLIEAGHIPPPAVTHVGELSEETIREAHARLEGRHVTGKLVLTVGGGHA